LQNDVDCRILSSLVSSYADPCDIRISRKIIRITVLPSASCTLLWLQYLCILHCYIVCDPPLCPMPHADSSILSYICASFTAASFDLCSMVHASCTLLHDDLICTSIHAALPHASDSSILAWFGNPSLLHSLTFASFLMHTPRKAAWFVQSRCYIRTQTLSLLLRTSFVHPLAEHPHLYFFGVTLFVACFVSASDDCNFDLFLLGAFLS